MKKNIFTLAERCVACKSCEIACAVEHSQSKELPAAQHEEPRPRPRVRIIPAGAYSYPARCQHCQDAPCVTACPMGAMRRDSETDAVVVDEDKCIGCWMCVVSCPFGAVSAAPEGKTAFKCDLCPERTRAGLDPACVSACPTRAIIYATAEEMAGRRREDTALSLVGAVPATPESVVLWRTLKGEA